jgi:hypothetical protein
LTLKGVHIIFIVFATVVSIIFGVWAYQNYSYSEKMGYLIAAAGSFILAAVLAVYGALVAKKLKIDSKQ